MALDIYNGDLKGYSLVPDEKDAREADLRDYMQDLIKTTIHEMVIKFQSRSRAPSELQSSLGRPNEI